MKIVVTGYASLDYCMRLDSPAIADRTATILSRPRAWPRLGGSPAYVCAALAAAGVAEAAPVSWIADDAEGARYLAELERVGVASQGVRFRPGRTPVCMLAYEPDGGCHCFYDPGLATPLTLDETQRALIAGAEVLCATVGPAQATREALDAVSEGARVVWAVKADRRATPPDLAAALALRADIVVHSRGEAPFVAEAFAAVERTTPVIRIETRGPEGVAVHASQQEHVVPVEPLDVEDATGAGDAWLGGFMAAHLARGETLEAAARSGIASVRAMLIARSKEQG